MDKFSVGNYVYADDFCYGKIVEIVDEVAYVRFASVYREFKDVNAFMDELATFLKNK